jgi:hypothetical protein
MAPTVPRSSSRPRIYANTVLRAGGTPADSGRGVEFEVNCLGEVKCSRRLHVSSQNKQQRTNPHPK